jgi:DNA (cytosine-5)-methyltransferase 1
MAHAGFQIIWSQEVNQDFRDAHDYGMAHLAPREDLVVNPAAIVSGDDIRSTGPVAIRRQALGGRQRGEPFGIIGGPPCPDFSVGGKNRGSTGDRGLLTQVFIERILELEPSFFIIENVRGLVSTHKHREFITNELWKLEEKGYAVDMTVLNALEFGVPQDRHRVFIVGVKSSLVKKLHGTVIGKGQRSWFPWPLDERYCDAKIRFNWADRSPFGSNPEKPLGLPDELIAGSKLLDQEELSALPNGTEYFTPKSEKVHQVDEGDVSRKSFKRLHRYRYSPAAAYGNNEVHLHPILPRRLSVREAMRIQSVPDEFALPPEMSLSAKFKLVGNGVPVKLAHRVGQAMAEFLSGPREI